MQQEHQTIGSISINEVELSFGPRERVLSKYRFPDGEPEMSEFESGFLCGILKKYKPQKIVEVGIAGGATTAIILECLEEINKDYKVFSIDYSKTFYKDPSKQAGYLAEKIIKDKQIEGKHQFCLGDIAYNFMYKIGADIDCLILDTMHLLPGEVMDAITLLPFMRKGGIIILHDISWNLYSEVKYGYATGAVMSALVGKKLLNYDRSRKGQYPNIGAVIIDENTINSIGNLFQLLFITWRYIPEKKQITEYRKAIEQLYGESGTDLFDKALELNGRTVRFKTRIREAIKLILKGRA